MSQAILKQDAKLIKNNREPRGKLSSTTPCGSITCSDEIEIHMSNNQEERVQGI